jgi:hypothetical protein
MDQIRYQTLDPDLDPNLKEEFFPIKNNIAFKATMFQILY